MNNKNLDALFDGLTGTVQKPFTEKPERSTVSTQPPATKSQREKRQVQEERFCTIVRTEILRKIRLIANREGLQIKDVVDAAFVKAIESYESRHGEIEAVNKDLSKLF